MSFWSNLFGKQETLQPQLQQTAQNQEPRHPMLQMHVAQQLVTEGKLSQALDGFINPAIAEFEEKYRGTNQRVYCANGAVEQLTYLGKAAKEGQAAVIAEPGYAYAYFLRGYIAVEQKNVRLALECIGKAVELSPYNPQFLCELANIYQNAREWAKALELYEHAAENASMYERQGDTSNQRRALRGKAYVLIELQKLEDAERLYRRCLELDPQDRVARRELEYLARVRSPSSSPGGGIQ